MSQVSPTKSGGRALKEYAVLYAFKMRNFHSDADPVDTSIGIPVAVHVIGHSKPQGDSTDDKYYVFDHHYEYFGFTLDVADKLELNPQLSVCNVSAYCTALNEKISR